MSLTVAGKNLSLDALNPTTIKLHTADPTDNGSVGEVSGGAYAAKAASFAAASAGSKAMSGALTFDIPAGVTVSHYSTWDNQATPVCVDKGALPAPESYTGAGTYELTSATITAS